MNHSSSGLGQYHRYRPSGWSADGRFIAYTLSRVVPAQIRCLGPSVVRRSQTVSAGSKPSSPRTQRCSLRMDGGSRTRPTKAASPTSTFNRFQRLAGNIQVSRDGGSHPVWRADGKELFYLGADATMMAVPIDATGQFDAGVPQALFPTHAAGIIESEPGVRRDEGWQAIPGQREAAAVQRGAADRRRQLDGRDPEITETPLGVHLGGR